MTIASLVSSTSAHQHSSPTRRPHRWALLALATALAASPTSPAAAQGASPRQTSGSSAAASTPTVDALIARASATYRAARTATASFQQTLTNPMTGSAVVTRGVLQRRAPDRYAFRFTDPDGDRIISDGTYLWVYTPSTTPGQVIRLPAEAAGGGMLDPGAQFFESPRTRFDIADGGATTMDGRPARILTLTPKAANAPFRSARVWLDTADGTLRQFETLDGMGVKRLIRLSDLRVNVELPGGAFSFTPPKGVRVVDAKDLMGG